MAFHARTRGLGPTPPPKPPPKGQLRLAFPRAQAEGSLRGPPATAGGAGRAEIHSQTPILHLAGPDPTPILLAAAFRPENLPRERPWRPGSFSLRTTFAVGNPCSRPSRSCVHRSCVRGGRDREDHHVQDPEVLGVEDHPERVLASWLRRLRPRGHAATAGGLHTMSSSSTASAISVVPPGHLKSSPTPIPGIARANRQSGGSAIAGSTTLGQRMRLTARSLRPSRSASAERMGSEWGGQGNPSQKSAATGPAPPEPRGESELPDRSWPRRRRPRSQAVLGEEACDRVGRGGGLEPPGPRCDPLPSRRAPVRSWRARRAPCDSLLAPRATREQRAETPE